MPCKHDWTFMGITLDGMHPGMAHRSCKKCHAQLYTETTKQERKKHDPRNELQYIIRGYPWKIPQKQK